MKIHRDIRFPDPVVQWKSTDPLRAFLALRRSMIRVRTSGDTSFMASKTSRWNSARPQRRTRF